MANIKGTNVSSPVVPFTDQDIYATHEAKYGKGGFRTVDSISELNSIPEARLEEGMVVYVINDPSGIHTYQLINGSWVRNRIGKGIPVYNQELMDELGVDPASELHITIPDDTDLNGEIDNTTYQTSTNGTYIDVLFKSIRALQSEVAKLKNSFNYGIESYTGTTTAMSAVQEDLANTVDEEPLWAVEEDGLSEIDSFPVGSGNNLSPEENVEVVIDSETGDSYLRISSNGATWSAPSTVTSVTDNKLYLYTISTGTSIKIKLNAVVDSSGNIEEKIVDYSKLHLSSVSEKNLYNTLLIVSRQKKESDGNYYGKNFIWISVSDPFSDTTLVEGYWRDDSVYSTLQELEDKYKYRIAGAEFSNTVLSKFKLYSKYQDFTNDVVASKPTDESYKYKTAHITIRSVDTQATLLSIKDQLLENELIWEEANSRLWIKSNYKLTVIGSSGTTPEDTGMTKEEMIAALEAMGIVQETDGDLKLANVNIDDITFIHQSSGKRFKFYIDDKGELHSQELANEADKFATRLSTENITLGQDVRGFIGQLRTAESAISRTSDARLCSDRLKIGAFYAPYKSDIVHGCSHSYVELENTSDTDYPLSGCFLHYTRPDATGNQVIYHLALTGIIPAGGTYLIRGAQHVPTTDPNVYLKVTTFDQEWYYTKSVGVTDLMSFEINDSIDISGFKAKGYGFALTYGNTFDSAELTATTALYRTSTVGEIIGTGNTLTISVSNRATYPYIINPNFIDGLYYYKMVTNDSSVGYWASTVVAMKSNSIYRNVFELDPAKQAFQSFTIKDSSRARWASSSDIQVVTLDNEYITFPHTDYKYSVTNYTPKASFDNKNVCTDKTKLDPGKPNMVTTSFGIDIYKTRCFNWVSLGYYPEYVWIKATGDSSWINKTQSYLPIQQILITAVTDNTTTTVINFTVSTAGWTNGSSLSMYTVMTDASHNKIVVAPSYTYNSAGYYSVTLSGSYGANFSAGNTCFLHQSSDNTAASTYPKKKFFSADITNNIYARITGRFPADNSFYTSHKVIVDVVSAYVQAPTEYTYVVGRAGKDGNPDPLHCSEEMKFTMYPTSYTTQIFQITDQQGFHWIEYQVWSSVASKINDKIIAEKASANIIPILLNTGDMTQNGTRVNEWFDYYQGGKILFNHLEQMNVVGNNDLCGTDPSLLGTGDDTGKSNSFYFQLFYCYEVGSLFTPLCPNKVTPTAAPKYIPSLYYFDSLTDRFLMVNSEITEINCQYWFGLVNSVTSKPINIYTGYDISGKTTTYNSGFTTIYTMIRNVLQDAMPVGGTLSKNVIAACHEMPFTVITNDSLLNSASGTARSISNSYDLVGSHLNQISSNEVGDASANPPGIYWFSRLLEYYGVKLVLGGHKHTYAATYPVRENYTYLVGGVTKSSQTDGPMVMGTTLSGDTVNFISGSRDLSKFPLTKRADIGSRVDEGFYPAVCVPDLTGGVTYFMCQASGYKLTSNKELPSAQQKFSRILPSTTTTYNSSLGTYTDKANNNQKYPMFSIVNVNAGSYTIRLARVTNVMSSTYTFTQYEYSTGAVGLEYLIENGTNNFGTWGSAESILFTI